MMANTRKACDHRLIAQPKVFSERNTRLLPAHYNHSLPKEVVTLAEAFKEADMNIFCG